MQAFFLAALAFALVAIMFALQNAVPVQVRVLTWSFGGSLALVLFVALVLGALVSALASVPSLIKARSTVSGLKKRIAALENELERTQRRPEGNRSAPLAPAEGSPGRPLAGDQGGSVESTG